MNYSLKLFDDKKVFWFEPKNQYLLLEDLSSVLLEKYINGISFESFIVFCESEFNLSEQESCSLFENCKEIIEHINALPNASDQLETQQTPNIELEEGSSIFYHWNAKRIQVIYQSEQLKNSIHPKFKHLQIDSVSDFSNASTFHVFRDNNYINLYVNHAYCGSWLFDNLHLFQGKFSMKFLTSLTGKKDNDWLATLHASAVYKQDSSLVMLGKSGQGKSTATTLLMAHGYKLLADDFVPIERQSKKAFPFPQAISVKESHVADLSIYFPKLLNESIRQKNEEIQYRYLYPEINKSQVQKSKKCKAFIFIQYNVSSVTNLIKLKKSEALELLIPDSWISPKKENSMEFLDLILETPCYTLEYSENESMLRIVDQLMANEL